MTKQFGGIGPDRNPQGYNDRSSMGNQRRETADRNIINKPEPEITKQAIIPLLINLCVFFPIGLIGAYWAVRAMVCEFNNDKNGAYIYYTKSKKFMVIYAIVFVVLFILTQILNLFS